MYWSNADLKASTTSRVTTAYRTKGLDGRWYSTMTAMSYMIDGARIELRPTRFIMFRAVVETLEKLFCHHNAMHIGSGPNQIDVVAQAYTFIALAAVGHLFIHEEI